MHWLIAEDEADIRNLVVMMAQVWGNTSIAFENGQKVWDWLDEVEADMYDGTLPEFALMDIRMPGHRGDEIAGRLRRTAQTKNIPIVLMTAFVLSDAERQEMIDTFGVDKIINKPLPDFQELQKTLYSVIESKK